MDRRHGYGAYTSPDGYKYEGMWEDGREEGKGKYKFMDGKIRTGIWKAGVRVNWIEVEE